MSSKFLEVQFVPEFCVFFALVLIWSSSNLLAALAVASLADLAISAIAWRMSRHETVKIKNNNTP